MRLQYKATIDCEDADLEHVYKDISEAINQVRDEEILIIPRDLNVVIKYTRIAMRKYSPGPGIEPRTLGFPGHFPDHYAIQVL